MSADYRFVDRWRVRGSIDEVAAVLADAEALARWWPSTYLSVRRLAPGGPSGVGDVGLVHARGWLPYEIRFLYRVTDADLPHGFGLDALGDLTGRGEWALRQDGPDVAITYTWTVRSDKPLLQRLGWLLRPLFESNHRWTMRRGEESLRLELARRRATTDAERAAIPTPPGPVGRLPKWWRQGVERLATLRTRHEAVVPGRAPDVFAYVADVTNDLDWQPDIREVVVTSRGAAASSGAGDGSDPSPSASIAPGATFREVRVTAGRRLEWDMVVTALEPPRRIAIESVRGAIPYRGTRAFSAAPDGAAGIAGPATRIVEASEARLPLWLWPAKGRVRRASEQAVAAAYARLGRVIGG